jgi:PAS domain S-box-containing protein
LSSYNKKLLNRLIDESTDNDQPTGQSRLLLSLYTKLFESSPTGMIVYDAVGQCIEANEASAKIIGASRNQVLSQNYHRIESWKTSGLLKTALTVVKEKIEKSFEVNLLTTFGKNISINFHIIPFSLEKQDFLFFIFNDITVRKQAETSLKESEQHLRRAQRITNTGSWQRDFETRSEFWSKECFSIFGINQDDYPGNIVPESVCLSLCENPPATKRLSASLAAKNDNYDFYYNTSPINGKVKRIHSFCEVERDNDGHIKKIFGSSRDITDQKQSEMALKESEQNLKRAQRLAMTGSWIHNFNSGNEKWSNECFKIFGLDKNNFPDNIVSGSMSLSLS